MRVICQTGFSFRNILADQLLHDSLAYGTVSCDTDFIVTDCVQVRAERSEECVVWGKAGSRGGGGGLTTSVQVLNDTHLLYAVM